MESDGTADPATAAADLATLRAGRAGLAQRAVPPWWYDVLLGVLVFGLFASCSAHDNRVTAAALVVFLAGVWGLVAAYRRIAGMWVSGLRPGRTRRAVRVWFVLYLVVLAAAYGAEYGLDLRGAMVAGGAVLGVGVALISRWWTRIYVAELREEL
jgi:hypothetical protein